MLTIIPLTKASHMAQSRCGKSQRRGSVTDSDIYTALLPKPMYLALQILCIDEQSIWFYNC